MKITTDRKTLADALAWIGQAVPARPASPILAGIKITATDDLLVIEAFDYEIALTARVSADVGEPGTVLVPGHLARAVVGSMRGADVTVDAADGGAQITCGASSYRLAMLEVDDYPRLPEIPEPIGSIPAETLTAAVGRIGYAADTGNARPWCRCVHLETDELGLHVVACDSHRLAAARLDWQPVLGDGATFAIDVEARSLTGSLKGLAGPLTLGLAGDDYARSIGLSTEARTVVIRATSGVEPFPKAWRTIRDKDSAQHVEVDGDDLRDALRRIAVVLPEPRHAQLSVDRDGITLRAVGEHSATEEIGGSGEPFAAKVDVEKLMQPLGVLATARLGLTPYPHPLVLDDPSDPDTTHVLMPIKEAKP